MLSWIRAIIFCAILGNVSASYKSTLPEPCPTPSPCKPACTDIATALSDSFPVQTEVIVAVGLLEPLSSFRGTIFLPTAEAFAAAFEATGLNPAIEADQPVIAEIITLHALPDVTIYSGTTGLTRAESLLGSDSALKGLCSDNDLDFTAFLRINGGVDIVKAGAGPVDVLQKDIELCGPTVVHVINEVLLPCALLG